MTHNKSLEGYDEDSTAKTHKMRKNHLLIIAIDKYKNGIQNLNNAVRDAEAVKNLLWESYQFSPNNTTVLLNKEATRGNIITAFEDFIEKLTPNDNFIFYFSGHGDMYKPTKRGFWIPTDGKPGSRSSWISNNTIKDFMEFMQAHHVFGIVDSCFSGALFRKNAPENINTLNYLDGYPSRWLLTAGRETVVPDGEPGTHSPFAKTLISQLKYNPDDAMAVSKLCSDVIMSPAIDKVNAKPRGSALPLSSSQGGEFIFYKKGYSPQQTQRVNSDYASRKSEPNKDIITTAAIQETPAPQPSDADLKSRLKKLVRIGELEKAFDILEKKVDEESRLSEDLMLLQSRHYRIEREKKKGLITNEYYEMSSNKITHAFLSYIGDMEEEDLL